MLQRYGVYFEITSSWYSHLSCTFNTFSITSRTQPSPPPNGDIYLEISNTSATASAGQQGSPTDFIKSISGRSSAMYNTSSQVSLFFVIRSPTNAFLSVTDIYTSAIPNLF